MMWGLISLLFVFYFTLSSCHTIAPISADDQDLQGYYRPASSLCPPGCCCWSDTVMILRHADSYELLTTLRSNDTGCPFPSPRLESTSFPTTRVNTYSLTFPTPGNLSYDMKFLTDPLTRQRYMGILMRSNSLSQCYLTYYQIGNMQGNMCTDPASCQVCVTWSNYHHSQQGSCDPTIFKDTSCNCNIETCTCSNTFVASFYIFVSLLLALVISIITLIFCAYFSWCPCHPCLSRFFTSCYESCCCHSPATRVADWFKYHVLRKPSDINQEHSEELMMDADRHRDSDGRELHVHGDGEEYKNGNKIIREEHKTEYQKWKEKQDMEDDIAYQELFA